MSAEIETKDIIDSFKLQKIHLSLSVFIVAKHRHRLANKVLSIPLVGEPLGSASIDKVHKAMTVSGLAWFDLGKLYTGYALSIGTWVNVIPLPDVAILKQCTSKQTDMINAFKSQYATDDVEFQFIQMNC